MPLLRAIFLLTIGLSVVTATKGQQPIPQAAPPKVSAQDRVARATSLAREGKVDEALTILNALAAEQPGLPGLERAFAIAYYKKSDFPEAIPHFQRALQSTPDDKESVQLLGLSYYFVGKPAEAIPLLEKVQSWLPVANVDAAYVLGVCYIQVKDYEHARRAFAAMYGVPADSAASHLFLARMLLRQGFEPIAEEHARQAVSLDPKLPLAHYLLGELYMFKSRIPEAIAEFEKELALNPGHAATYYKLADAYSRDMKFDDAERLLQRSIWLDSTASGPFVLMGKVLLRKGDAELAVRYLERAIGMDANNFMAHYLLGQGYRTLGRKEEADRELQISQKLQAAQNRSEAELR